MKRIGEGSVTTVFLAQEAKLERLVALKVLKAEFAADAAMHERFRNEADRATGLVHPNVAALYRVGKRNDGLPYFLQEYVGGQSLADMRRTSQVWVLGDVIRTLGSIAKALAAAHAKGIVHGAVHAGNVLIERDSGRTVVTDFGLSGKSASPAEDINGLGLLAYELLAGHGSTPTTVDLKSARPEIPGDLAQLLGRCLDKDPNTRPTAEELVRRLVGDERVEVPLKSNHLTQRTIDSSLMRIAVVAGLIIMAFGAGAGLWIYLHYSEKLDEAKDSSSPRADNPAPFEEPLPAE